MEYKILQLKDTEEAHKYMFLRYREDRIPSKELYDVVYSGEIEATGNVLRDLECLYTKFNVNHPTDFKGHSMSVSDIVELAGGYYYCDSFGFVELKNW